MSDPRPHAAPRAQEEEGSPSRSGDAAWMRYGTALAAVIAATILTFALFRIAGADGVRVVFVFYFAAVFLSAWRGGVRPGLVAILLSVVVADYYFFPPYNFLTFDALETMQMSLFAAVALLIVFLTEKSRRAEAAAEKSSESLATTLMSIGDAVIATDTRGRVTFMNGVAENLTGWSEQEAAGNPLPEVFRIVNEDSREVIENPVERVLRDGKVSGLANHTILLAKGGAEIPIDNSGAPIKDRTGNITGVVLVFQDITRRRRAEETLRSRERELTDFIENATLGLHWVGPDGTILWANRAELEMLGYDADEYIGHNIAEFHVDPEVIDDILKRLTCKQALENYEARLRTKDGSIRYVLINSNVMWGEGGKFVHTRCFTRDITARKRAEEALLESEKQLQLITDSAPVFITYCDAEMRFRFVNKGYADRFGMSPKEIVGKRIEEVVGADAFETFREYVEAALAGQAVGFEAEIPYKSIGRHFMRAEYVPHFGDDGEIRGFVAVISDITDRKQAEEAVRESERRYRSLAEAMPLIVWTARDDGYFDYYNNRWFEYTGTTLEETEGWGWQRVVHPDDAERCIRQWATAVMTGREYYIEYRFRRASDGAYRWHLGRAKPMRDAAGRIMRWFGTATDIHDQKQAEEALRYLAEAGALLASSLDYETTLARLAHLSVSSLADYCLIDVVEDDGKIRRVATAHVDPSKEELVRELERYPPSPDRPEGVARVLRTGRPEIVTVDDEKLNALTRSHEHTEILRRLGLKSFMTVPLVTRERTIGAITFALVTPERAYTGEDLAFGEELARRAALAIDNARLYGRAREVNRVKDEFLATLSHELRTPLTPIIGWVHMIRSGRISAADITQGLSVIDKNSQSLARLINDLLDMSSILSGKMRIERAPVEIEAVIRQAIETVRPEAEKSGVGLEVTMCDDDARADGDGQPPSVSGDSTRLVQVFCNLLNNAVKFSEKGGHVRVECRADGGRMRVSVEDEGIGIAPDFLPHVFERFRQADGSSTRAHGGLGIGLALVKSFVEAHGGAVEADSPGEGLGSRFTVVLPLLAGASAAGEEGPPHDDVAPCPGEVCHVLVVEDARDTLDMLRVVFEARGYQTTLCESADEALRVARGMWFDIIVSDIGLPQIDGYELIKRLREIPHLREVAAVALTGYAAPKDAESALAAGFDAHIAKPVEPALLAREVEQLLQAKSRRAESEG
ncbi:MAG TPA: PAS domain S-box protein [Pyrinomonadaceae bacterium]|nr:PAS domain S-box protein [Pyrinomonadaceae bacterium]